MTKEEAIRILKKYDFMERSNDPPYNLRRYHIIGSYSHKWDRYNAYLGTWGINNYVLLVKDNNDSGIRYVDQRKLVVRAKYLWRFRRIR